MKSINFQMTQSSSFKRSKEVIELTDFPKTDAHEEAGTYAPYHTVTRSPLNTLQQPIGERGRLIVRKEANHQYGSLEKLKGHLPAKLSLEHLNQFIRKHVKPEKVMTSSLPTVLISDHRPVHRRYSTGYDRAQGMDELSLDLPKITENKNLPEVQEGISDFLNETPEEQLRFRGRSSSTPASHYFFRQSIQTEQSIIQKPLIREESSEEEAIEGSLVTVEPFYTTYRDYFGRDWQHDTEIRNWYLNTVDHYQTKINPSNWDQMWGRALTIDKYTAYFQGMMGSAFYCAVNGLFDILAFTGNPITMSPHIKFSLLGAADYLSGRICRGYFQQAYYTRAVPGTFSDQWLNKRPIFHHDNQHLANLKAIAGTFTARNVLRMIANQIALQSSGQRAWEIANSIGDNIGSLPAGAWSSRRVFRNNMYDKNHPIYLLAHFDTDRQLLDHLIDSKEVGVTWQSAKNFGQMCLRDLPRSLLDTVTTSHGLMHSLGIMATFELLSWMYQTHLSTMSIQDYGDLNNQTNLNLFNQNNDLDKIRIEGIWLDAVKLFVVLPSLYTYLTELAFNRERLDRFDQRVYQAISHDLPNKLYDFYHQVSQWWHDALTPELANNRQYHHGDVERGYDNLAYSHSTAKLE